MRRFVLAAVVACLASTASAAEVAWAASYDEGLKAAKESGKLLMVDFFTSWWGYCKKLDAETYPEENVAKALNEQFVCVKVDGDQDKARVQKYHVSGFPSIAFLDGNEELVYMIVGYRPPAKFLEELKKPAEENQKFNDLEERLSKNIDDPQVNYDYALALLKRGRAKEGAEALDKVAQLDPEDQAKLADDVELVQVEQLMDKKAFADAEAAVKAFFGKHAASDLMPKAYLFLGIAQINQNRFDDGIASLNELAEKYPDALEAKQAKTRIIPWAEKKRGAMEKPPPPQEPPKEPPKDGPK